MQLIRLLLVAFVITPAFAVPSITHCGGYVSVPITYRNLRDIAAEWQLQCESTIINCPFDAQAAQDHMRRHPSPKADKAQISAKYSLDHRLQEQIMMFVPMGFFVILLGLTFSAQMRSLLLATGFLMIVGSCNVNSWSTSLAGLRYPGSYAFIDDFRYLTPPFAHHNGGCRPDESIVAFERVPEQRGFRTVATASGKVVAVPENLVEDRPSCIPSQSSPIP